MEEALRLVNISPYGLTVAIHSADSMRACERVSQIHSGMVQVNDQTANSKRIARPPFPRTPWPASPAFANRRFTWKRCTRNASPGRGRYRTGGITC
ncbi:aldehyde dehydrogenase family protein [Pseudomonas borbori]|uniref:aldehyde dehydrogenase family protein n=1 Tax=Pseudomonas borbori TaxID=289003 RepID=UPI00113172B9